MHYIVPCMFSLVAQLREFLGEERRASRFFYIPIPYDESINQFGIFALFSDTIAGKMLTEGFLGS